MISSVCIEQRFSDILMRTICSQRSQINDWKPNARRHSLEDTRVNMKILIQIESRIIEFR